MQLKVWKITFLVHCLCRKLRCGAGERLVCLCSLTIIFEAVSYTHCCAFSSATTAFQDVIMPMVAVVVGDSASPKSPDESVLEARIRRKSLTALHTFVSEVRMKK